MNISVVKDNESTLEDIIFEMYKTGSAYEFIEGKLYEVEADIYGHFAPALIEIKE